MSGPTGNRRPHPSFEEDYMAAFYALKHHWHDVWHDDDASAEAHTKAVVMEGLLLSMWWAMKDGAQPWLFHANMPDRCLYGPDDEPADWDQVMKLYRAQREDSRP